MKVLSENEFHRLLLKVNKPGRYIGNEINTTEKKYEKEKIRFCLAFPDMYEIGMSNLSLKILYSILNGIDGVYADRAFYPEDDMLELMREKNIPLWGLDSLISLKEFDFLGFTIQHELNYSTLLQMMKISDIPIYSKDRDENDPIIIGGGPCMVNPEPGADFFDLFVIGDAEHTVRELMELYIETDMNKIEFLENASSLKGVYIPSKTSFEYDGVKIFKINQNFKTKRNIIENLDSASANSNDIVPYCSIVHDRAMIEIQRGCDYGCRFCMAGFYYRPRRERSIENLVNIINNALDSTGWEEITLASLSSFCHGSIGELIDAILPRIKENSITLGLPSLRINHESMELFEKISSLKKTGITIVPEAGSEMIRRFINKKIKENELIESAQMIINKGWQRIKLYFMIGFVPETDEDVIAIADFSRKILTMGMKKHGKRFKLTVSVSNFVPKPYTPFQWEPFLSEESFIAKQELLKARLRGLKNLSLNFHDLRLSKLEAVFSRGDRRLSKVLEMASKTGIALDSWSDHFNYEAWEKAFNMAGIKMEDYLREREEDEILPWESVDMRIDKEYLLKERKKAYEFIESPPCTEKCSACGSCTPEMIANLVYNK